QCNWIEKPKRAREPLAEAVTVFTDAGRKSRTAAATWQDQHGQWNHHIIAAEERDNLQTLELLAVVWVMIQFEGRVNIVTDSLYVAGVCERLEDAHIKAVQNPRLYELFL
ncbi:POK19 protein, partial [Halcyon senegalensis]|nr:POK19 protein [Halcyon senegalensis]